MKILIIGHARHGKDTVAEFITELCGLTYESSSVAASRIFLYELMKEKYGYATAIECFNDRVNHRQEWYELITEYNKNDKARLAKAIVFGNDIYVGMRDNEEFEECLKQGVFDLVIGVHNYREPDEPKASFNIDFWDKCDIVIPNSTTLDGLKERVKKISPVLV